jgi:hypothetical protein
VKVKRILDDNDDDDDDKAEDVSKPKIPKVEKATDLLVSMLKTFLFSVTGKLERLFG